MRVPSPPPPLFLDEEGDAPTVPPSPPAPQVSHRVAPGRMGPPPPKPPSFCLLSSQQQQSHKPPCSRSRSPSVSPPSSPSLSPSSSPCSSPSRAPMGPPPPRASPPTCWSTRSGSPPPPPPLFSLASDRHHHFPAATTTQRGAVSSSLSSSSSTFSSSSCSISAASASAEARGARAVAESTLHPPVSDGVTAVATTTTTAMAPPPPRPPRSASGGDERPRLGDAAATAIGSSGEAVRGKRSEIDERVGTGEEEDAEKAEAEVEEEEKEEEEEEGGEELSRRSLSGAMAERGRDSSLSEDSASGGSLNGKRGGRSAVTVEEGGRGGERPESGGGSHRNTALVHNNSTRQEAMERLQQQEQPQGVESHQQQRLLAVLPSSSAPPYVKPTWSSAPAVHYVLEVLKEGMVLGHLDVSAKGAYMFGRSDRCDFMLEHPTISRFHAVIQYGEGGTAFVFDLGSTHGTFINKQQVKPRVYVPLHVGNLVRFGKSSRLYVFQGPIELMPEEGLSRAERHELRLLEAVQGQKERETSLARASAASRAAEVTWGMREDAEEEEEDVDEVTWRTYKGRLTEKQEKISEKIQKREEKLSHLKREIDAIQAKELSQGGLTQGQQTQIARNEQRIELLMDELESLEETLNESVRESVGAKSKKRQDGGEGMKSHGSDEDLEDSDSDEFYDRAGALKRKGVSCRKGALTPQKVETAETLIEKKYELERKKEDVLRLLKAEEMSKSQGQADKGVNVESDDGGGGEDGNRQQTRPGKKGSDDPLDAYMSSVSSQIEKDRASGLKRQLEEVDSLLERVVRLLEIADPTGEAQQNWQPKYCKQGSRKQQQTGFQVSPLAAEKHRNISAVEQQVTSSLSSASRVVGKEEMEKRMKASEDAERPVEAKESAARSGIEENAVGEKSKESMGPPPPRLIKGPLWLGATRQLVGGGACERATVALQEGEEMIRQDRETAEATFVGRKELKKQRGLEQLAGREEQAAMKIHHAEVEVKEDVALLLKHSGSREEDEEAGVDVGHLGKKRKRGFDGGKKGKRNGVASTAQGDDDNDITMPNSVEWLPPEGQTGDGRTSLNDKLGY